MFRVKEWQPWYRQVNKQDHLAQSLTAAEIQQLDEFRARSPHPAVKYTNLSSPVYWYIDRLRIKLWQAQFFNVVICFIIGTFLCFSIISDEYKGIGSFEITGLGYAFGGSFFIWVIFMCWRAIVRINECDMRAGEKVYNPVDEGIKACWEREHIIRSRCEATESSRDTTLN